MQSSIISVKEIVVSFYVEHAKFWFSMGWKILPYC